MKRSEFVDIVNDVANEERNSSLEKARLIQSNAESSQDMLTEIIGESYVQSAEIAARVAAKIIERAGLVQFDAE